MDHRRIFLVAAASFVELLERVAMAASERVMGGGDDVQTIRAMPLAMRLTWAAVLPLFLHWGRSTLTCAGRCQAA